MHTFIRHVHIGLYSTHMQIGLYIYILKAKSNFTLLLYIFFLGIGEWYFKCVSFILKFNQLFIRPFKFHVVAVINATTMP